MYTTSSPTACHTIGANGGMLIAGARYLLRRDMVRRISVLTFSSRVYQGVYNIVQRVASLLIVTETAAINLLVTEIYSNLKFPDFQFILKLFSSVLNHF
jgi:hypothetical protein